MIWVSGSLGIHSRINFVPPSLPPKKGIFKSNLWIKRTLEVMIVSQYLSALTFGKSMSVDRLKFLILSTTGILDQISLPWGGLPSVM